MPPTDEQIRDFVAQHGAEWPDNPERMAIIRDARERGVLDRADEGETNAPIINTAGKVPLLGTWMSKYLQGLSEKDTKLGALDLTGGGFSLLGDLTQGAAEAAYNVGFVPAAAGISQGGRALFTVPYRMYQGNTFAESMMSANEDMNKMFGTMAWTPRSASGKIMMGMFNTGFQIYDEGANAIAQTSADTLFDGANMVLQDGTKLNPEDMKQLTSSYKGLVDQYRSYVDNGETPPAGLVDELNKVRSDVDRISEGEIQDNLMHRGTYATIKTLLDFAPDIATQGRSMAARSRLVKQTENQMRELGLDPDLTSVERIASFADQENLPGLTQSDSTQIGSGGAQAEVRIGAGNEFRGDNLGALQPREIVGNMGERRDVNLDPNNLQESLRLMDGELNRIGNMLFQKARETTNFSETAGLEMGLLNTTIANTFKADGFNFRPEAAPRTNSYLREIDEMSKNPEFEIQQKGDVIPNKTQIGEGPFTGFTDINKLWEMRRRINGEIRNFDVAYERGNITPDLLNDRLGLYTLRKTVDDFLDSSFESDMFSGNPQAQAMWRDANKWYSDYVNKFQGTEFINKMTQDRNLTGEEVHRMIFGLGDAGLKPMAAEAVRGIGDVFGYDSKQMDFLRNDVMFDLFEPLQRSSGQNFKQYAERYQNYFRKNRTIMTEMFTPDQIEKFELFHDIAMADLRVMELSGSKQNVPVNMERNVSQAAALLIVPGDTGLAMAQFRLRLARKVFDKFGQFFANNAAGDPKQRFMMEFLGLDPRATMRNMGVSPVPGDQTLFQLRSQGVREQAEQGEVGDWTLRALRELRDTVVRNNPFVGESEDIGAAVGQ